MALDDDITPVTPETQDSADSPDGGTPSSMVPGIGAGSHDRLSFAKVAILVGLVLLLAAAAYATWFYAENGQLPIPTIQGNTTTSDVRQTVLAPAYQYSIAPTNRPAVLNRPIGVGVTPGGLVFITDSKARVIRLFDTKGAYRSTITSTGPGGPVNPVHVAVAPSGDVYVTDRTRKEVLVYDKNGTFKHVFPADMRAVGAWRPLAITVDASGTVYVSDTFASDRHRVIVFAPNGKVLRSFGRTRAVDRATTDPGTFFFPNGLAVDKAGRIFVADGDNRRIQVFSPDGTFEKFIITTGLPRGLAMDGQDRLYVVDALAHQVDVYDKKGEPLVTFGENGVGPGQFSYPNDVALDAQGRIFVTDRENDQVQVWAWETGAPPVVTRRAAVGLAALGLLLPLALLALLFWMRKRSFLVTPDFVEDMIRADEVKSLDLRRIKLVVPQADHAQFVGRVVDGVDLGEILDPQEYSPSDAHNLMERLRVDERTAIVLAMAVRIKRMCTTDIELARLATLLKVDVYDRPTFIERVANKARKQAKR